MGDEERSKSSFDRFGDDLMEAILTFIPNEDKFRVQCASKRIQRLIFEKTRKLIIYTDIYWFWIRDKLHTIYFRSDHLNANQRKGFELILKKFNGLTEIEVKGRDIYIERLLYLLADNCPHLKSLRFDESSHYNSDKNNVIPESIDYFGQKCGQNIKKLKFKSRVSKETVEHLLSFTTNLEHIVINSLHYILTQTDKWNQMKDNNQVIAKLPKLKFAEINYASQDQLAQLQEEYKNEKIIIEFRDYLDIQWINDSSIQYFSRVRVLKLSFIESSISDQLILILQKLPKECHRLRDLYIYIKCSFNHKELFDVFGKFRQLSKLKINGEYSCPPNKLEQNFLPCFKKMINLKVLILHFYHLKDDHIEGIDEYLPQLRSLSLLSNGDITDISLEYISKLKQLESFRVICNQSEYQDTKLTDSGVFKLLEGNPRLRKLQFLNYESDCYHYSIPFNITVKSVMSFAKRAIDNPNTEFYLTTFIHHGGKHLKEEIRTAISDKTFPKNLEFEFNYFLNHHCNNKSRSLSRNIFK